MAKGLNRIQLVGNLGKKVEVRATHGGTTVANFSLATAERVKRNNEWVDETEWHSCVAFGRMAEILRDYTDKGSRLYLEGRLRTRSWEDAGQKRYRTEVIVSDVILLDSRKGVVSASADDQYNHAYGRSAPATADQGITDDDIPF